MSTTIHLPMQCHLWTSPGDGEAVMKCMDKVEMYAYDPHEVLWLAQCKDCGQLYFCEWRERVNYGGGEDDQYDLRIPVGSAAEALELSKQSKLQRAGRTALVMIFPPRDAKPYWINR